MVDNKIAIVNLSTYQYSKGRERLRASLVDKFSGEVFTFTSENEVNSPPHSENPYAFKVYAIEKIKNLGYTTILWLDASLYAVKDTKPVFDWLYEKGMFMEAAGHWADRWTNDFTLNYFGISREEAAKIPLFAAGYVGFDFNNPISVEFFEKWKQSMLEGCFKGTWDNHRHDMTCASIIAYQMGLLDKYCTCGDFFAYIGQVYGNPKDTVVFYLESGQ